MSAANLQKPAPKLCGTAVLHGQFNNVRLEDYIGRYVVLFFYPLDFTDTCSTDILALSEAVEEFRKLKCNVIGISCDSQFSHLAWTKTLLADGQHLNFPLFSDKATTVARSYGVYNEDEGISNHAVFVIDKQQILRYISTTDDATCSVGEILRLVTAIKASDEKGNTELMNDAVNGGIKRPVEEDTEVLHSVVKCRKISEPS